MPRRLFCATGLGMTLVGIAGITESIEVGAVELEGRVAVEGEGSFNGIFGEEELERDAALSLGI